MPAPLPWVAGAGVRGGANEMSPDWLGSPQHVIAGAAVAALVTVVGLRVDARPWICLALGVGAAMVAEAMIELFEYWAFNYDLGPVSAARTYFDTIADLASTLVGATAGALLAMAAGHTASIAQPDPSSGQARSGDGRPS